MPLAATLDWPPDWTLLRNIGIGFVVVLWLATAFWTFKDARRRIGAPWLVALATLLGLGLPFVGPIIYMFFRPPEYLQDVHERELEIKSMEQRIAQLDQRCPVCRARVESTYLALPGLHDPAEGGVLVVRPAARCRSGRCARTARLRFSTCSRRSRTCRGRAACRSNGASCPSRLAAAWLAKRRSSWSSPTAWSGAWPARSSRASIAAASSCAAPGC